MEIIIRATIIFWLLWLVVRGSGKKELAQLSAFDLVMIVVLGDIVQQAITQEDTSATGAALAISTIAGWVLIMSLVEYRLRASAVLSGSPVVIVWDGEVLESAMHKEQILRDELDEAARSQGIADLSTIRAAVLEADGAFSFVEKHPRQQPEKTQTAADLAE